MSVGIVLKRTLLDGHDLTIVEIKEKRLETKTMMIYMKERYISAIAAPFLLYDTDPC